MKILNVTKSEHIVFSITHNGGNLFDVIVFDNRPDKNEPGSFFDVGDPEFDQEDKPVKKITGSLEDQNIFRFGLYKYYKNGDVKVHGLSLTDEQAATLRAWAENATANWKQGQEDREKHRTAPYVDASKFVVYSVGCDTGLIRHEASEAINLALKKGAKAIPVLRGKRSSENKYPGQMDSLIDYSFAQMNENGELFAKGYEYVYEDKYCLPIDAFNSAKSEIEKTKAAEKEKTDRIYKEALEKAQTTREDVFLSKTGVLPEEDTPLKSDGEGDMVDVCSFVTPTGEIVQKYFHNY